MIEREHLYMFSTRTLVTQQLVLSVEHVTLSSTQISQINFMIVVGLQYILACWSVIWVVAKSPVQFVSMTNVMIVGEPFTGVIVLLPIWAYLGQLVKRSR